MRLHTRLTKLESTTAAMTTEHAGKPVRPHGMSDSDYAAAIKAKRQELKLQPSDPLPILSLIDVNGISTSDNYKYRKLKHEASNLRY